MHTVHVGFGFHVNCYHSYRGDTPDALGFGGDIRIMRHILDTLDDRNARGIPVKATWDFENAYSLESILPQYAPDIIERVRQRQAERGDENILMGYNNGAMSAMTEAEFQTSVSWAVTNPYGSGLQDLFGGCERIIRPQEVMFTPSDVQRYNRAGVKAVCLYYSCISFDAFRTLIPQLDDEKSFNPLRYVYRGEAITVIPTYSPNDIMDAGSLRALVVDLHEKQERGEIRSDVFLFLNTDADSFLWEPMAVPGALQKLPCFGGIGGYIDEIADLDFVRFDTPGGYLKDHEPVADIFFGQDVADGNLSGYMSWAEKPFNRLIWTRLERARAMARLAKSDSASPSFETRVRLLSTTHFGLASPVMNISRERKATELTEKMLTQEHSALPKRGSLTLLNPNGNSLVTAQLSLEAGFCRDVSALIVTGAGLKTFTACAMGHHRDGSISSVYLVAQFETALPEYALTFSLGTPRSAEALSGDWSVKHGALCYRGRTLARLSSWIEYDSKIRAFGQPQREPLSLAGAGSGVRLTGEIHLPHELQSGHYTFDFFTVPGLDCLFARTAVQYPYTLEDHEISSQASNLGRYSDTKWLQTAPFELTLELGDHARVTKRNFMDDLSGYHVASFWRAFAQNENISSFNHQLTGGLLSLADEDGGVLLAHARQVLGSMAHCPMRLKTADGRRRISMNPFGTYFGPQRHYPTRGNGSSMDLYLAAAPQARSLAPAYNGAFEQSIQAIFPLSGSAPDAETTALAKAIADGVTVSGTDGDVHPFEGDNVILRASVDNRVDPKDLKSVTFVEQFGGVLPVLGLVARYTANLLRAQIKMRRRERRMKIGK